MGEKCKVSSFSGLGSQNRRSVETLYVTNLPDKSNGTLIVIADGFGNDINSNLISKLVCENFISLYSSNEIKTPTKDDLTELCHSLHTFVIHKGKFFNSPQLKVAFMAVLLWDNHLLIGHVGNMSAFYLRKGPETEIARLTKSQRDQSIESVPALGMEAEIPVEIIEKNTTNGEKLFIVTDGITSVMSDEEIVTYIKKHPNTAFSKSIVSHTEELGSEENSSAVIAEFGAVSPTTPPVAIKTPKSQAEKPVLKQPKPKNKEKTSPKHSYAWFWWLLILGIISLALWWGLPRFQAWRANLSPKEPYLPITTNPPVEKPIEKPVEKDIQVLFQANPPNTWIQVISGKQDHVADADIRLYESHGETNQTNLKAGEYTVYAQLNGYESKLSHFTLANGQESITVNIILQKKAAPPATPKPTPIPTPPPKTPTKTPASTPKPPTQPTPPPTVKEWSIAVTSQPTGAKIYINNQFLGMFTPSTLKFKPGSYLVTVSKAGYKDQSRTVVFTANPPSFKTIHFSLEKRSAFIPGAIICCYFSSGEAI